LAKRSDFEVITFDCYGTLIDWETGIRAGFKQALENLGLNQSEKTSIFDLYEEEEKRIERLSYRPYRRVLTEALSSAANKIGKRISEGSSDILADQLPYWRPFPDTNPALQKLTAKFKLGILSNVDNDLLSGTLKNFVVRFDLLVTAENVRSYKPKPKHFLEAKRIIGDRKWLHVAASLYHDIEPASKLGIRAVWVNRKRSEPGLEYSTKIVKQVGNMTQLADWLLG
jgi:2-haloalkanoic acid dehalogenase type II